MGLPLRMDNIHAPTVPSGPTSAPVTNGTGGGQSLAELQRQKDKIEAELNALGSVLDSHGVDMNTPLLTPDGFPRSDIDVAQIRTTRARIIYLKNDYKKLMGSIEKFLHTYFESVTESNAEIPQAIQEISGGPSGQSAHTESETTTPPFARVNSVSPNGPSDQAGLKAGDLIRAFGYVDYSNHDSLAKVGQLVQAREGQPIIVKVSRSLGSGQERELSLTLTPSRDWGGRGSLGCHILPL